MFQRAKPSGFNRDDPFSPQRVGKGEGTVGRAESRMVQPGFGKGLFFSKTLLKSVVLNKVLPH